MTAALAPALPALGVGLGYREPFRSGLFLHRDEVSFLEITADHFLHITPAKAAELQLLRAHFPLIPHGLDLSLGSAEGLHEAYLHQFAALVAELQPPWCSEHLAFTRAGGRSMGHLAPVPFTREALTAVVRNVRQAQGVLKVPLIVENISYTLRLPGAEMSEGEFLTRLVEETGCGLLLDVTNLFINAHNLGFDPRRFLDAAPLHAVVQLHFVGAQPRGSGLLDTHGTVTGPGIWALLEEVLTRAPVRGAILERDENLPPFIDLLPELRQARTLGQKHHRWA